VFVPNLHEPLIQPLELPVHLVDHTFQHSQMVSPLILGIAGILKRADSESQGASLISQRMNDSCDLVLLFMWIGRLMTALFKIDGIHSHLAFE
jgi:hypothetical protein